MRYPGRQAVMHCIVGCVVATCKEVDGEWFRDKKKIISANTGSSSFAIYIICSLCQRIGPLGQGTVLFQSTRATKNKGVEDQK